MTSPEPFEGTPQRLTVNLAGLSEEELSAVSIIIGGSIRKMTDELPSPEAIDSLIMPWGDERLQGILDSVTQASGYPYGAERLFVAAIVDDWVVQMHVVPQLPYDEDAVTDDEGNISSVLLGMHQPQFNPNIDYYVWDQEGLQKMELALLYGSSKRMWAELNGYDLAGSMAMRTSEPYVVRLLV